MGKRGPQAGTNFKEGVQHSERHCDIHGTTTHRETITGTGTSKTWKCMACGREDVNQRAQDRKAGIPASRPWTRQKEPILTMCKTHNLALPATGECDYC